MCDEILISCPALMVYPERNTLGNERASNEANVLELGQQGHRKDTQTDP